MPTGIYVRVKRASKKTRKKMSIAHSGKNNGMYGRKHTEEAKEKIRVSKLGNQNRLGKYHTNASKEKMRISHTGQFRSVETREKIRIAFSGEKNPGWVYDNEMNPEKHYALIHKRIKQRYGKANRCESVDCSKRYAIYEWSNKDHKYSLDRKDWQMLCLSCHKKYDKNLQKIEK